MALIQRCDDEITIDRAAAIDQGQSLAVVRHAAQVIERDAPVRNLGIDCPRKADRLIADAGELRRVPRADALGPRMLPVRFPLHFIIGQRSDLEQEHAFVSQDLQGRGDGNLDARIELGVGDVTLELE